MNDPRLPFPAGFLWGSATASYQVEGAVTEDGRGPSIWDTFAAAPGNVLAGGPGAVACDHFHRYPDDIALMTELGLNAYRFSVAWSRIQPDGRTVEPRGLAFYDRLVDQLLEAGIVPMVTLYHWDLPQAVEDRGGWRSRDTALLFAEYAETTHAALGDRVRYWSTLNEPFCSSFLGHALGVHAPGVAEPTTSLVAAHHHLLAHGGASAALRAAAEPDLSLSLVLNFAPVLTDVDDARHREAARKFDGLHNRFFLDPVLGRGYPTDVRADLATMRSWESVVHDGDLDVIAAPLDWLGVNYYAPTRLEPLPDAEAHGNCALPGMRGIRMVPPRGPLTSFGWEQTPGSLADLLMWLDDYAGLPLMVTENGAAFADTVENGRVHDVERVRYFAEHLRAVHAAIERGADVRGYLAWSLLDNFEWALGYSQRFGIVHVNFETLERTVKDSARFLRDVIADNAVPVTGP